MANFTDAQVAAYIRDNKLDADGVTNAAKVFGLGSDQVGRAKGLLSAGDASIGEASKAYQSAIAANPELDKQNRAFYDASVGTGSAAVGVPQTQAQANHYYQQTYGWSDDDLADARRGQLHLADGNWTPQSLGRFAQDKSAQDQYQIASNMAGRTTAPSAQSKYRSGAAFNPQTNLIEVRDGNGVLLTNFQAGTTGSEFSTLDRLGVDTASYQQAVQAYLQSNPTNRDYISAMAQKYQPRFSNVPDSQYVVAGVNPALDASGFFGASKAPNLKDFMGRTGLDFNTASNLLYSHGLGSAAGAMVNWDAVMAADDPVSALTSAYASIGTDPALSRIASQAVSGNYAGWNIGGVPVVGGGSVGGGSVGGGSVGGGSVGGSGAWLTETSGAPVGRAVDAKTETIEGRIQGLLGTDSAGNYTNPVVQQAANRALQQFSGRGLLNSSMAQQAAIEAATSKAIEIAGPDAQTYFSQGRANQDAANVFERDRRGYAQENYRLDKTLSAEREKLLQQDSQFKKELAFKYDAIKLEGSSKKEAETRAHQNALEINNIEAVNKAYDLYIRRLSDIDNNKDYTDAVKIQMKNSAGKDFDLYAKAKGIVWEMSLGGRFEASSGAKPDGNADTKGAGMLARTEFGTGDGGGGGGGGVGGGGGGGGGMSA